MIMGKGRHSNDVEGVMGEVVKMLRGRGGEEWVGGG